MIPAQKMQSMHHPLNSLRTSRRFPFWPSHNEYQRDDEQKQDAHDPEYAQEATNQRFPEEWVTPTLLIVPVRF